MSTAQLAPAIVRALRLGGLRIDLPVVLAPMAGITNAAFRALCREQGAGLYVAEMVSARGVVERDPKTMSMVRFGTDDHVRSLQLYGVDPHHVGDAVRILAGEHHVQHVDLNFGCPVPKVTRRGGGAALPWKRRLLADVIGSAVRAAEGFGIPVTVKTRIGLDEEHATYLDAGRIAEDAGCAAIALHARTAAQFYSGVAHWPSIARLKESVRIPVLGNGDIWQADDALRMLEQTGCDGVVVGRGCLGNPWLFADLAAALTGRVERSTPTLGDVGLMLGRHARLLTQLLGEPRGVVDLRKHMSWYFKGYTVGASLRRALAQVSTLAELDALLCLLDAQQPFPQHERGLARGRQGSPRRVTVPDGWLRDRETGQVQTGAADPADGG